MRPEVTPGPGLRRALLNVAALLALSLCVGLGCDPADTAPATSDSTSSTSSTTGVAAGERAFQVRGVIRGFPEDGRSLLIRHEEIPGYMPKMTMELTLLDTNESAGLKVGDTISFRLVARAEDHFIDTLKREKSASPSEAVPDAAPPPATGSETLRELQVGDPVPEASFLLETGVRTDFASFRGRALAFTFFFTRCPLPDFCPRMNRHLQEARDRMRTSAPGVTNWQFLSLSFDAEFDQPAVLSAHASSYRGTVKEGWLFGAVEAKTLATLAPAFGLMLAKEGGGYSHNLRTVVVDPQGRIFRQFDGNRWTPEELAEALRTAAAGAGNEALRSPSTDPR